MFNKVKKLYKLKKQTDPLRKEMAKIRVEETAGNIRIVMRGDQVVEEIWEGEERRRDLEKALRRATKKVQRKLAKRMRGRLGDFGI